jgi:hypothetical protein
MTRKSFQTTPEEAAVKTIRRVLLLLLTIQVTTFSQDSLSTHLQVLGPFIGKTWRGEFKSSTPDKPMVDVARWERALNGKAIRILHSVNDGVYGGESIVTWDPRQKSLVYSYFTTAGFTTSGTLKVDGRKCIAHEIVTGSADGTTEVRATTELVSDGRMESHAMYLRKGKWIEGHAILYKEDPAAEVKFR